MTGMRKLVEKCRSWCSKDSDKSEESSAAAAYKANEAKAAAPAVDLPRRLDELLLMELQRASCLNCNLIAMGEMSAYADGRCPRCGSMTTR